jgi:uncharacterized protein (DUF58 family)
MKLRVGKKRMRLRACGKVFVIITFPLLLAAWNTGANLLYAVLAGLVSFVLLSIVMPRVSLHKVRVVREAPHAVHRGEQCGVTVRVENLKRLMPAVSVRIEKANATGDVVCYLVKVPARSAVVFRMTETFTRRGLHPLPELLLVSAFPFGLIESRRPVTDTASVLVYPRVSAVRAALLEQLPGAGNAPKTARGDGSEFFCLRNYFPGDEIRRIAWRASARAGTWLIKELERDAWRFVLLAFDTRRVDDIESFEERFEEAVDLVASLAVTLLHQHCSVALITPTARIPEGEGRAQVHKVLDTLARIEPVDPAGYADFDRLSFSQESKSAALLVISPDPRVWGTRGALGRARVLDPRDVVLA